MAGAQDSENPVGINVVPMVDVIFCLCVFFMCSMNCKEHEGDLETWLPKDKGLVVSESWQLEELRVALTWDASGHRTIRQFGRTVVRDDDELRGLIRGAYVDRVRIGHPDTPCIVDAGAAVPWKDVVRVVDLAKREGVEKIEFAAGADYEALPTKK